MTSDRPYRAALAWRRAGKEILAQAGSQFDPAVVRAFRAREGTLRRIHAASPNGKSVAVG